MQLTMLRVAAECDRRWLGGVSVRFLIYFLVPVPLALLCVLGIGMLMGVRSGIGLEGLVAFLALGLGKGYQLMGVQSAAFALVMVLLERRSIDRGEQCIAAAVVGGLCGGSVALWDTGSVVLFVVVGALVGPGAMLIADMFLGRRQQSGDCAAQQDDGTDDASARS